MWINHDDELRIFERKPPDDVRVQLVPADGVKWGK